MMETDSKDSKKFHSLDLRGSGYIPPFGCIAIGCDVSSAGFYQIPVTTCSCYM